jgi:hypothetical protein
VYSLFPLPVARVTLPVGDLQMAGWRIPLTLRLFCSLVLHLVLMLSKYVLPVFELEWVLILFALDFDG